MSIKIPDWKICPICNSPNGCQFHGENTGHGDCWCTSIEVPDELLQQVPEYLKNKACICRKCIEQFTAGQR